MAVATTKFLWDGAISWYPGHMAKAARLITERMKNVDILLEVRDARIPFSSHNTFLEEVTQHKERVILFNKSDLADPTAEKKIIEYFEKQGRSAIFLNGSSEKDKIRKVIPMALSMNKKTNMTKDVMMIVMGIPNVGKSTLINSIKSVSRCVQRPSGSTNVAKTGPRPGVTRHMSSFRVSDNPPAFLFDTPGVMLPRIEKKDNEVGLKLALTGMQNNSVLTFFGAIKDSMVDSTLLADYLLHSLNKQKNYSYMKIYNFPEHTDSIETALSHIANKLSAKQKDGHPNLDYAAHNFLEKYRKGAFGKMTLDEWEHL